MPSIAHLFVPFFNVKDSKNNSAVDNSVVVFVSFSVSRLVLRIREYCTGLFGFVVGPSLFVEIP